MLVLTSTYPRWAGDTEPAFVHEMCIRLAARYEVVVLAPHAPGSRTLEVMDGVTVRRYRYLPEAWESLAYAGGIPERLRRDPIAIFQVPFLVLALFAAAIRECLRRRVDIIHAHWIVPQGVVGALLSRMGRARAFVCTSHGADLHSLNAWPVRWLKSWTVRRADALTVVSRAMLGSVQALGIAPEATHVAPMGVDVSECFTPPQTAARQEGLVLFVGRLVEKKGVRHLIEAFGTVHRASPDARLVIVGEGPESVVLRREVASRGLDACVTFAGAVPRQEVAAYFRSAAVAVFPFMVTASGDQEGLGLVVVEAQACGCPVIASDLPAVRDTIEDGSTGLLVRPRAPDELARAILGLLSDRGLAQRLGSNGRQAAVQLFDWDRVGQRYLDILQSAHERAQKDQPTP
ncbi:MAG: glycosyltransferase [Gammaproteobacteria bacterium]|nr:glycosyltransferase [Gammaproteobacteria bacterium]